MKTIGDRIKQARIAKGWSASVLALKSGYKTQSAISNLENRATGTGGNKISVIASALGVSVDWLINGPDTDSVPFHSAPQIGMPQSIKSNNLQVMEPLAPYVVKAQYPPSEDEVLHLWRHLTEMQKIEWIGDLKRFVRDRLHDHV